LEIHSPGEADANLYAYVSGAALRNIDPMGLEYKNVIIESELAIVNEKTGALETVSQSRVERLVDVNTPAQKQQEWTTAQGPSRRRAKTSCTHEVHEVFM
jgi:hypothetical protein